LKVQSYLTSILEELSLTLSHISNDSSEKLANAILDTKRVFIAGSGRSGLAVRAFSMRLMHMGRETHIVGDVTTPGITREDLLLIGSGSGTTGNLLLAAQKAKAIGTAIALITIAENSPIGVLSDIILTIPAPTPKAKTDMKISSIQPMGSLFEQSLWLTLDAIILILMSKTKVDSAKMFTRHANLE